MQPCGQDQPSWLVGSTSLVTTTGPSCERRPTSWESYAKDRRSNGRTGERGPLTGSGGEIRLADIPSNSRAQTPLKIPCYTSWHDLQGLPSLFPGRFIDKRLYRTVGGMSDVWRPLCLLSKTKSDSAINFAQIACHACRQRLCSAVQYVVIASASHNLETKRTTRLTTSRQTGWE